VHIVKFSDVTQEISSMAQYGYLHTVNDILWDNGGSDSQH